MRWKENTYIGKTRLIHSDLVRENDILCLLESEREARRLR
jgi:ribosomal protein S28E/S33